MIYGIGICIPLDQRNPSSTSGITRVGSGLGNTNAFNQGYPIISQRSLESHDLDSSLGYGTQLA